MLDTRSWLSPFAPAKLRGTAQIGCPAEFPKAIIDDDIGLKN
jgi:hypothetical protein